MKDCMIRYEHHYYAGDWQKPLTTDSIDVISSATEKPIGRVPRGSGDDVDRAVKAARAAAEFTRLVEIMATA